MRDDGLTIHVVVNHFKSQSGGGNAKRGRQADRVAQIATGLAAQNAHVIVMGDLNEGPAALGQQPPNIGALFNPAGPLRSVFDHAGFARGQRPGTWQSCGIRKRFDYILSSQRLFNSIDTGQIFRCGLWGTSTKIDTPADWDVYPEITKSAFSASDHAAVQATFNV